MNEEFSSGGKEWKVEGWRRKLLLLAAILWLFQPLFVRSAQHFGWGFLPMIVSSIYIILLMFCCLLEAAITFLRALGNNEENQHQNLVKIIVFDLTVFTALGLGVWLYWT